MKGRYLVELGYAVDMHGGDMTKVCRRAIRDAMSHCCLCGMSEILGFHERVFEKMHLTVRVGCSYPNQVDQQKVLEDLSVYGNVDLDLCCGGLQVDGFYHPQNGEGDKIEIAVASITVRINEDS